MTNEFSMKSKDVGTIEPDLIRDRTFTLRLTGLEFEKLTTFCKENRVSKSSLTRRVLSEVIK